MPDAQIHPTGTVPVPADYVIPGQAEIRLKSVYAKYDGSAAAGSYKPLVRIISDAGSTVIEAVSDTTIAAGASADASWFPHLAASAVAATSAPINRFGHYDVLTCTPPGNLGVVTWGPIGGGVDFQHGAPIFDFTNPQRPVALADGIYSASVWANLTTGQGTFVGEYSQLAVDFDTHGDNSDLVAVF